MAIYILLSLVAFPDLLLLARACAVSALRTWLGADLLSTQEGRVWPFRRIPRAGPGRQSPASTCSPGRATAGAECVRRRASFRALPFLLSAGLISLVVAQFTLEVIPSWWDLAGHGSRSSDASWRCLPLLTPFTRSINFLLPSTNPTLLATPNPRWSWLSDTMSVLPACGNNAVFGRLKLDPVLWSQFSTPTLDCNNIFLSYTTFSAEGPLLSISSCPMPLALTRETIISRTLHLFL